VQVSFIQDGVTDGLTVRRTRECRAARPFLLPCRRSAACTWLWIGPSSRSSGPITGPGRVGSSEGPCISASFWGVAKTRRTKNPRPPKMAIFRDQIFRNLKMEQNLCELLVTTVFLGVGRRELLLILKFDSCPKSD